jgi:hypothetical protein
MGYNINTTKRNGEYSMDTSKEVGPVVNTEKTTSMMMSCHQNGVKNHNIKSASRPLYPRGKNSSAFVFSPDI